MKRKTPDHGSEPLFDLPLDQGTTAESAQGARQPELPLDAAGDRSSDPPSVAVASAVASDGSREAQESGPAGRPFRRRLTGGLIDLAAHLGVLALAVTGSAWLGVPPSRSSLLPLVLFGAGFSFIYHVLPLVFWGRTPGMATQELTARSLDGRPLTIGQAVRRWLGLLLNLVFLGLPFAILRERSLSDRLSRSTVRF